MTIGYKKSLRGKIRAGIRFKAPFVADCCANPPYSVELFPISIFLFRLKKPHPIWRIKPKAKEAVKARIGPLTGMGHQSMFHRVVG